MASEYRNFLLNDPGDRDWASTEINAFKAIIDRILDDLIDSDRIGSASGIASLDSESELTLSQLPKIVFNTLSTGLISGGELSINVDDTKYDISAGRGFVIDNWTDTANPTYSIVEWESKSGNIPANLAIADASFISLDSAGNIVESISFPENDERRSEIYLGKVVHRNNGNITIAISQPDTILSTNSQLIDLFLAINFINIYGNVISANGSNLQINKSAGSLFGNGINYGINKQNPHVRLYGAGSPQGIRYFTQANDSEEPEVTEIDPNNYDLSGVKTLVPSNKYTVQRVFLFASGKVAVQYGQTLYNSMSLAISSVAMSPFIKNSDIEQNSILIGLIIVKEGTTDLTNTDNSRFFNVSKFGESIGAVAGTSVTDLQNAYDNSPEPEIVTDTTNGAVTMRDGTGVDGANILEFQNSSGTIVATIDENGVFTGIVNYPYNMVSTSVDYTASINDYVLVTATSNVNVTLPSASTVSGKEINIKKVAGASSVFIEPNSTETIDDNSNLEIKFINTSINLVSDGSNWVIK